MKTTSKLLISLFIVGREVSGHGNLVWPNNWFDKDGRVGMYPGGQCVAGGEVGVTSCLWFNNYTFISGAFSEFQPQ